MKPSRVLFLGLLVFGAINLLFSRIIIQALPDHTTGSAACGVGGFWNLFLDLATWILSRGGWVFGGVPLVAGILGLLSSALAPLSSPLMLEVESTHTLEEKWEYLPQEGRSQPPSI